MQQVSETGARRQRVVGALLAASAILATAFVMGRAAAGLTIGLAACLALWLALEWGPCPPRLRWAYGAGIVVQAAHLGEEYGAGFYRVFPERFGYTWSAARFLAFNLTWLVVFVVAYVGLHRGARLAYLPVLFLAVVGGIGNGIVHLVLAAQAGGYFAGLYTAPLCLVAGTAVLNMLAGALVRAAPPN